MKNQQYIMIGSPIITKELFRNVLRPFDNYSFKPQGGFWSSKYINTKSISEWCSYLSNHQHLVYYKNARESTIFTLKEEAKILLINNTETVLELIEKYPSYHHILGASKEIENSALCIDYEKLSQEYDGIYLDYHKIRFNNPKIFESWSVSTLLLFNLDCIKEYQRAQIHYELDQRDPLYYIYEDSISDIKKIDEESFEHQELSKIAKYIYLELMSKYQNYSFKDYDEYLETAIAKTSEAIKLIMKNEDKKIAEIQKLLKSQEITKEKIFIIGNILLNNLTNYFLNDEERIKHLQKTKIKESKNYFMDL